MPGFRFPLARILWSAALGRVDFRSPMALIRSLKQRIPVVLPDQGIHDLSQPPSFLYPPLAVITLQYGVPETGQEGSGLR